MSAREVREAAVMYGMGATMGYHASGLRDWWEATVAGLLFALLYALVAWAFKLLSRVRLTWVP